MPKYTRKPIMIEAIQWDGRSVSKAIEFCGKENLDIIGVYPGTLKVKTDEGVIEAEVGDYIVKAVGGAFRVRGQQLFERDWVQISEETGHCNI